MTAAADYNRMSLAEAAVIYAEAGFRVFRCKPGSKKPLRKGWQKEATADPAEVRRLWKACPEANIGLPTGAPNGLWVLDIDGPDGATWLTEQCALHGPLPKVLAQKTGGGGAQMFFALTARGEEIRNRTRMAPEIDARGTGGYVVMPPSVHPSGPRYAWLPDFAPSETPPAEAPAWLVEATLREFSKSRSATATKWRDLAADGVDEGGRNDAIASMTGHLLRKGVDLNVILELLLAWNSVRCRPPLADDEVDRTVASIAECELRRRGAVK